MLLFQVGFNQAMVFRTGSSVISNPWSLKEYVRPLHQHLVDIDQFSKLASPLYDSVQRETQNSTLSTAKIVSKIQVAIPQAMVHTVWLFTRPLSFFPPFGITSEGKPALRHWGVLVSELTLLDVQVIMQRTRGIF